LDEIAEMPPALQAKLLHVLQDQEFTRLGGCSRVKVDVRVIAATNVNVVEALANKRFREDLYYRLSAFVFSLPPLRERKEDMPVLLRRYLRFYADRLGLPERAPSVELWQRCLDYGWPGNVRELENFAKRYLLLGEGSVHFSSAPGRTVTRSLGPQNSEGPTDLKTHVRGLRDGAEVSAIAQALETTNWNRKEAARILNVSYKTLLSKIRLHGMDKPTENATLRDFDATGAHLDYASEFMAASGKPARV
jgi:DNA-binding NtrC family response regulator